MKLLGLRILERDASILNPDPALWLRRGGAVWKARLDPATSDCLAMTESPDSR